MPAVLCQAKPSGYIEPSTAKKSVEPKAAVSISLGASAAWMALRMRMSEFSPSFVFMTKTGQPKGFRITGLSLPPESLS